MLRKLFALVTSQCQPDSADSAMNQEVLLGGHLYLMVLKERLEVFLRFIRVELERRGRLSPDKFEGSNGSAAKYAAPLAITLPLLLLCVQLISSTRCCLWLQTLAGRWSTFWRQGTSGRGLASVSSRWVGHQEGNTYDHVQCSVEWGVPLPSLPPHSNLVLLLLQTS